MAAAAAAASITWLRLAAGRMLPVAASTIKNKQLHIAIALDEGQHARAAVAAALEGTRDCSVGVCAACGHRASGHSPTASSDSVEVFQGQWFPR